MAVAPVSAETGNVADLQAAVETALSGRDMESFSLRQLRQEVAQRFGLPAEGLEGRSDEIRDLAMACAIKARAAAAAPLTFLDSVLSAQDQDDSALQQVYFITISRTCVDTADHASDLRNPGELTREEIATAIRDAFDKPAEGGRAGRPRESDEPRVVMLVVFREHHADGSVHYHAAVKLASKMRFLPAKRALRERRQLASHFSCSHKQFWSAVRYGFIPSPDKPTVDSGPHTWSSTGRTMDLFALSQEPFEAEMWRRRREAKDAESYVTEEKRSFTKMDLTSVIISKHLYTKEAVVAYVQDHGTALMQAYVNRVQRRLPECPGSSQ